MTAAGLARRAQQALLGDRVDEAAALYSQLADLQPERPEWPRMRIRALIEWNRIEEAEAACRALAGRGGSDARLHMVHGDLLRALGREDEARAAFRAAVAAEPGHGRALWSLARQASEGERDALHAEASRALARTRTASPHAALLHFALGEIRHARHDYPDAFIHFAKGNAILKAQEPCGPDMFEARPLPERLDRVAPPSAIFIVGMPRAGSTLLERMLGCHSAIEALGELPTVSRLLAQAGGLDDYLDRALRRRGQGGLFIDKMHMNWRHVPEILGAIPGARIVDLRRDAMDCCWSNFRFPFQRGHPAATDQTRLAEFYRLYAASLDEAASRYPDRVITLSYEALAGDPAALLRALLDWLDLPFEEQCLEFHRSAAPVATASSEQVRRPLNREGIGAHRPYRPFLDELAAALGLAA